MPCKHGDPSSIPRTHDSKQKQTGPMVPTDNPGAEKAEKVTLLGLLTSKPTQTNETPMCIDSYVPHPHTQRQSCYVQVVIANYLDQIRSQRRQQRRKPIKSGASSSRVAASQRLSAPSFPMYQGMTVGLRRFSVCKESP